MPRVISGSAGGIRLTTPDGLHTRPTADRVKEALFSILMPWMPANGFLDLYAGSGQVGLEAASRGSDPVILVERSKPGVRAIRENIVRTRLDRTELMPVSVEAALPQLIQAGKAFDVIFLDPPYRQAAADLRRLEQQLSCLLAPDGVIVLELDEESPPTVRLTEWRRYRYGTVSLILYRDFPPKT